MLNLIKRLRIFFTEPRGLTVLFITWLLYSAGLLSLMAINDLTPPHCFSTKN